ncbi:MAG: GGDEF domain-containing protein [Treponema sp.]|nr:GGDEF domain-containing protein [Treponema sp.]
MIMNNVVLVSCTEIGLFCIAILLVTLNSLLKSPYNRTEQYLFVRVIVFIIAYTLLNICKIIFLHVNFHSRILHLQILSVLYYPAVMALAVTWFIYGEYNLNLHLFHRRKLNKFFFYPTLAALALSVASLWTGWIVRVEGNSIIRGQLFYIFIAIPMLLNVLLLFHSFSKLSSSQSTKQSEQYRTILIYSGTTIIFSILQLFVNYLPILCIGLALSVLKIFIILQSHMISLDPLTNISNRYQYEVYIADKIKKYRDSIDRIFIFLIDIDYFKKINDTYGHTEGDQALIRVANALRKASENRDAFIARYSGDEFILVFNTDDELEVLNLKVELQDTLFEISQDLPYKLMISTGISEYKMEYKNAAEFLSSAETELCKIKKRRT